MCVQPSDISGYDISEITLTKDGFRVDAECNSDYYGNAELDCASVCGGDSVLSGCDNTILPNG